MRRGEIGDRWKITLLCLSLIAAVWLVYGQTIGFGAVNIDDGVYVFQNRLITAGLTRAGIVWYLHHAYCDYWAPLLAISQMADCQLCGLWPGGHHLTNVLLFAATVILLFLLLRQLTGALWRSAFVAAAWALHPLRVESVAWITERKDTLSGLFFLLTLAAYLHYVRGPRSWRRYLAVTVLFALGLMCKPTVVTLPFVLLLLDHWPLQRCQRRADWRPLLAEKIPLFVLSGALCMVTVLSGSQTLMSLHEQSLAARAGNAVLSSVIYLGESFYPAGLAAFYPYPTQPAPLWEVALALALLGGVSTGALATRRTQPWLVVGWFWYLGMLVPMLSLVQAGEQARADRCTYLPQIGLLLAITWTVWHWAASTPLRRFVPVAAAATLAALLGCAGLQAAYWRDSETLWKHALACTSDNSFAQNNLGVALLEHGRQDEAEVHFLAAVEIQPRHVQAQYNLGNLLLRKGRINEAIARYRNALDVDPGHFDALNNLGIALARTGRTKEALAAYRRALVLRPEAAEAHRNFGQALLEGRQTTEALGEFAKAIKIEPHQPNGYDDLGRALLVAKRPEAAAASFQKALDLSTDDEAAYSGLGSALFLQGHLAKAVADWQKALAVQPAKPATLNNLAWVLATGPAELRDGPQAVQMAESASRLTGGANPVILRTLAAAYAEAGRLSEARETAGTALKLANAQSNRAVAAEIEREQVQYEAGSAFHELPKEDASLEKPPSPTPP